LIGSITKFFPFFFLSYWGGCIATTLATMSPNQ
jgi:hypothetical protein